jgi:hypothetical protein
MFEAFWKDRVPGAKIRDRYGAETMAVEDGDRFESSTFDANVKDKLPKVISSFANSHGGVLVVGVNAVNGVPKEPFNGIAPERKEEYQLTVENICLQGINPPVFPRTQVVQSDVPEHIFLVIEVDESGEAPHAIENSKKVCVRTGNAVNPYDLAEVDLIIDLLKRREEPLARRERLLKFADQRSRQPSSTIGLLCRLVFVLRFQESSCARLKRCGISCTQYVPLEQAWSIPIQ